MSAKGRQVNSKVGITPRPKEKSLGVSTSDLERIACSEALDASLDAVFGAQGPSSAPKRFNAMKGYRV